MGNVIGADGKPPAGAWPISDFVPPMAPAIRAE
jgi:hypothetical protein